MSRVRGTWIEPYGVRLRLATTERHWASLRRGFGDQTPRLPDSIGYTQSLIHSSVNQQAVLVWIAVEKIPTSREAMLVAVHEAVHAAGMVLDHIGQHYDGGSEALAYLVDWVTSWLWAGLADHYDSAGMLIPSGEVPAKTSPGG